MPNDINIHPYFLEIEKHIYKRLDMLCTNLHQEPESAEYCAYTFDLNNRRITFRLAKITPTKIGQFVTLWKRIGKRIIA